MTFSHVTAAKLAIHFNVTVPAMRKALIARELLDECLNAPTAEGHLLADAYYVERFSPEFQAFPVWSIDKIAELLPEISNQAADRENTHYGNRFEAGSALGHAGGLLDEEFEDDDLDIAWLCFEHGGGLITADTRAGKKAFAEQSLRPRVERIQAKIKRQKRGKKPGVRQALEILRGVLTWASGEAPRIKPQNIEPLTVDPEIILRDADDHSFMISSQEETLLNSGFTFIENLADSTSPCFQRFVVGAMLGAQHKIAIDGTYIRMINRDNDLLLLLTYFDDEIAGHGDWGHAVWRITIDQLRLSFIESVEPGPFLDELTFIIPGDKCNYTKSRYAYRLLADIDRFEGEMKQEKQDAYYELVEFTEASKPVTSSRLQALDQRLFQRTWAP